MIAHRNQIFDGDNQNPGDTPEIVMKPLTVRPLGLMTLLDDTKGRVLNFTEGCGGVIRLNITVGTVKKAIEDATQAQTHTALQSLDQLGPTQAYDTYCTEIDGAPPLISIGESARLLHSENRDPIWAYQNLRYERMRKVLIRLMTSCTHGKVNQINGLTIGSREAFEISGISALKELSYNVSSSPTFAPMAVDQYLAGVEASIPNLGALYYDIVLFPLEFTGEGDEEMQANVGAILYHQ